MNSINPLRKELAQAARIKEPAERSLRLASLIAEALRAVGRDPVLVGGAAVEFYTQGGYTTADIDMLAPGGKDLQEQMAKLGFERMGKDYVDETNKIYVEFPGDSLSAEEVDIRVQLGERWLRVISIEDLTVDRLCSFKFWQSSLDGLNALKLLESGPLDKGRLEARALSEGVSDALAAVQAVREAVIRKKLAPDEANRLLETAMRKIKK